MRARSGSTAWTIGSGGFMASTVRRVRRSRRVRQPGACRGDRRAGGQRDSGAGAAAVGVPLESLHGRKDDLGRTLRLTVRASCRPRRSASSRSSRSRATCARCSCRWRGCSRSSRSAAASTRSSCGDRRTVAPAAGALEAAGQAPGAISRTSACSVRALDRSAGRRRRIGRRAARRRAGGGGRRRPLATRPAGAAGVHLSCQHASARRPRDPVFARRPRSTCRRSPGAAWRSGRRGRRRRSCLNDWAAASWA